MDFGLESGNDEVAKQLIMDWRNAALSPEDTARLRHLGYLE